MKEKRKIPLKCERRSLFVNCLASRKTFVYIESISKCSFKNVVDGQIIFYSLIESVLSLMKHVR